MSAPDTNDAMRRLREAAGDAPLPPLSLDPGGSSTRKGMVGRAVNRARSTVLKLMAPSLGALIAQLERDRHRTRSEINDLRARLDTLERSKRGK